MIDIFVNESYDFFWGNEVGSYSIINFSFMFFVKYILKEKKKKRKEKKIGFFFEGAYGLGDYYFGFLIRRLEVRLLLV